jgi:peptidoglycan/LPS O-acetylase OafA/YrhL
MHGSNAPLSAPDPLAPLHQAHPANAIRPRFYKPELDVLRAIAFLFVLDSHILPSAPHFTILSALSQSGTAGVCLFFTLSAFLITALLLRERETTGTVHIRDFYIRRILRIWPLYFLILGLGIVVPHLVHRSAHALPVLLPYLLFCGNWAIVWHGSWFANPLIMPLWSISVEEQFYIIWPALVRRWAVPGIVVAACLTFPIGWATDYAIPHFHRLLDPVLWVNSLSQFQFFGLGALLAVANQRRTISLNLPLRALALLTSLACFLFAAYPDHFDSPIRGTTAWNILSGYFVLDLACLLLFVALLNLRLPSGARPFVYLGKISYGLYVFHFIVAISLHDLFARKLHLALTAQLTATYAATLTLSVAIASASYYFYEKPFLRFKHRFTHIASRVA